MEKLRLVHWLACAESIGSRIATSCPVRRIAAEAPQPLSAPRGRPARPESCGFRVLSANLAPCASTERRTHYARGRDLQQYWRQSKLPPDGSEQSSRKSRLLETALSDDRPVGDRHGFLSDFQITV